MSSLNRDALVKFHQTWFHPNNATLVIVGDTTMAEMKPKLEKLFGGWARGEVPEEELAQVQQRGQAIGLPDGPPRILQSIIFAANLAPPRANPDEISFETFNTVLGGAFTSRLNMNLREDKHWAYGSYSFMSSRPRAAPVHRLRAGPDRQDQGVDRRDQQGTARSPARPSRHSRRNSHGARQSRTLSLPGSRETRRRGCRRHPRDGAIPAS